MTRITDPDASLVYLYCDKSAGGCARIVGKYDPAKARSLAPVA